MLLVAGTMFGIFLPTVLVPYAFCDDYSFMWMAVSGKPSSSLVKNILDWNALGGRPFKGILTTLVFPVAGTIENLRFVRLIGLVALVVVALLLHLALVRSGIAPTIAALIAVLMCSMPAFQVIISYSDLFVAPLAMLLAGGASLLAVAAVDGSRDLVVDRLVGAAAMLLAALMIYQPAAMFFWVFFAIAVVGARLDARRTFRLTRAHLGVGAVALALEYLVTKLAIHYFASSSDYGSTFGVPRTALTHDVVGKARWFFEQPLYRSLNLFDLTPSRWLAAVVALLVAAGIVIWLIYWSPRPLLYIAIGLILVPLSYTPNLVVVENVATYRTQVALSALIALYVCLGLVGLWLTLRDWLEPRLSGASLRATERAGVALGVVLVASTAFIAARNVTTLFVEPQMTELRIVRSQVQALPNGLQRVAFVEVPYQWGLTNLTIGDEFGIPTTCQTTVLRPLVLLLLHEEGRLPRNAPLPTVDLLPYTTTTYPHGEPVIDVRGLRQLRSAA